MSIKGSDTFKAFYNDLLLKDPEKIREEQSSIYEKVKDTFTALATYSTNNPAELKINNQSIAIKDLNASDIKVFAKFAKSFFDEVSLSEKQALEISQDIDLVRRNLPQERSFSNASEDFQMAKNNIFLHENIELSGETEAEKQLIEIIKAKQITAQKEKKQIQESKYRTKTSYTIAAGAAVIGLGSLAGGIMALILNAPVVILISLTVVFFVIALLPAMELIAANSYRYDTQWHQATFDKLVGEMEKHENYKKLMSEPKFREEITNYKKMEDAEFLAWLETIFKSQQV